MTNLIVNGEPTKAERAQTVAELLDELGYQNRFVAVAINRAHVPRSEYGSRSIREGDEIEILAPMAGG